MENSDLLYEFQNKIVEIYNAENLYPIRGKQDDYLLDGKPLLLWHSETTRHCGIANNDHFDYVMNADDLLFTSDEIVYFTAHLYFYRPFINNPLYDSFRLFDGTRIFPNEENLPSKRYDMYTGIVFEKIYNYWDRLGDLIASFFPEFPEHKVLFSKIIDYLKPEFENDEDFKWLINYKNSKFIEFNKQRKKIVHYHSQNTTYKFEHIKNASDEEWISNLIEEKKSYPEYFKTLNEECKFGLIHTLKFLEKINIHRKYPTL